MRAQDGLGLSWSEVSPNAPFGAVQSAAMVGLYDHSILLCGGQRNSTLINECWLSQSLGQTWTLQPSAPWSPRSGHSLAVDGDDLVYLVGGLTSLSSTASAPLEVWVSNSYGAGWSALQLSTASSSVALAPSVVYGCSFIRQLAGGVRQLLIYSGSDASGAPIGVVAGNLTITALAPPSSTAIALSSSAAATAKPALPSSTAGSQQPTSQPASAASSSGRGTAGATSTTSSSVSSSSSSSTGNTQTSSGARWGAGLTPVLALLVAVLTGL